MAKKYFEIARSDFDLSGILGEKTLLRNAFFQLAQSFEKANKSFLISISLKQNPTFDEKSLEREIHKFKHNKKEIVNKIVNYLENRYQTNDFDIISKILSKKIKAFELFNNLSNLHKIVQDDFRILKKIKSKNASTDQELEYLRKRFSDNDIFRYKILTYVLIRYFADIENNLRYPTNKNNYSFNIFTDNNSNKKSLNILRQFNEQLFEIISSLRTNL